jgi:hypothetical protein
MPQSDPAGSGALSGINLDRAARVNHAAGATDDHAIALAWAADPVDDDAVDAGGDRGWDRARPWIALVNAHARGDHGEEVGP